MAGAGGNPGSCRVLGEIVARRRYDYTLETSPDKVGLPVRPFLYTPDQIAGLIAVDTKAVKEKYLWYDGRSVGPRPKDKMTARNIAPEGERPQWRVAERELVRWLRVKGFRFYERTFMAS